MESHISINLVWTNIKLSQFKTGLLIFYSSADKIAIFWITLDYSFGGGSP